MNITPLIKIDIIKPNGITIPGKFRNANSFLGNFIGFLCGEAGLGSATVKDTGGTSRSFSTQSRAFYLASPINNSTYGIVVGTSSQAIAIADYNLIAKINTGTGAGQLQYSAVEKPTNYIISGSDAYFEIRRTFTNNSGSTVTIEEVGIITYNSSNQYFLLERTLSTQAILNTEAAVITYKFIKTI